MNLYRFSPIESEEQLLEAIRYTHARCFELCHKIWGKYLPVAGNMGIFCHYEDEYKFLTKLRQQLTIEQDNWNKKYYRLCEPIVIPRQGDIPETVYTYLYIRRPDEHKEVGDVDFVLNKEEFIELKAKLFKGIEITGMEILDRPDLDLVKLHDSEFDVIAFIGKEDMQGNIKK